MATCASCDKTIFFGGKKEAGLRFCNSACLKQGSMLMAANEIPLEVVQRYAREIHSGACPKCKQQRGPVDVHTAHSIWSFIVMSSWVSKPQISCRACRLKSQILGTFSSLLLGWWGIPWGIVMTPIQVGKNLFAMLWPHESTAPSAWLEQMARLSLVSQTR